MNHYPFDWKKNYPTIRVTVFARNVVATSQPLAAQAGLRMLAAGGNAIDATVAAAAAMTVVEPVSNGLGSDAFAIVWDGRQLHGLNSSGVAPAAWDVDYFERRHGGQVPKRGWDSVTVPGAVASWAALHEKFGRLPFADVIAPAIELAERGFGVSSVLHWKWLPQVDELKGVAGFAGTFLPRGRTPAIGECFAMPAAARTLARIAQTRGRDFYEGETAQMLAAHANANGGSMTTADLAAYRPEWVGTISKAYGGYELHEIPPNGQGIAALMALGIVSNFDLASLDPDSADARHMTDVTPAHLLDDDYLKQRASRIRLDRASEFGPGRPPAGGTIYLSAADESGMMVSFIQSNYMGFGSGVVVPDAGVSLQNRGFGFHVKRGHPNCVAPGKRPFHTIIPAFLTRDGKPQMSFGVMGGDMQPQGHLQTLLRMLAWKQNPQAACDAPRWKVNRNQTVDVEGTMEPGVVDELRRRGHVLESKADPYMDFGSGQFIWRLSDDLDDGYVAASDSRRDGHAACF